MRNLRGLYGKIAGLWVACASLFHLYTAAFGILEPRIQRSYHLLFLLPGAFLYFPATKKSPKDRFTWLDACLAFLAIAPSLFLILENDRLNLRFEHVTDVLPGEFIMGVLVVILLLEGIRRAVVPAMAALGVMVVIYLMTCQYFPEILHHRKIEIARVIEQMYLLKDEGIYGSITGVSATFVALFVIFGAFIYGTGTGRFFTNLACKLAGGARGGPAKIAVISSGLFATISGVAAANVYATGTFSIPLMKKLGYRPQFAGAVEAAASTGGMIMPPIMGAGAFVMAEITGISYIKICIAATIGAVMYYFAVGMMVHLEALKHDLKSLPKEEIPAFKEIIKDAYLILPLVGLIYLLVIGYSPFMAAFVAIILSLGIMVTEMMIKGKKNIHGVLAYKKHSKTGLELILSRFAALIFDMIRGIKSCLTLGGKNMIMVALACAGAGMIISVITNTGLGLTFSSVVVAYSGGIYLFALFFIMIASIILGMGLPCTPAYIIAVSVGAPALLKMGGDLLATHLFVFYFAILAAVTPPVCIAAYAGASLANTNPLKTGFEAFKLALAGFFVPYAFYFDEALLMRGTFLDIFLSIVKMFVVITLLAIGLEGWFLRKIPLIVRSIIVASATMLVFMFSNNYATIFIGLAVFIILFAFQSWLIPKKGMSPLLKAAREK